MEIKEFCDSDGSVTKVKQYKDMYLPVPFVGNDHTHLDDISDMVIREDDVMIATYPKSGTHWVVEIVKMLQSGNTEYVQEPVPSIEFNEISTVDLYPSPRILQAHLPFKFLPKKVKKQTKTIYVSRNPKDTAVSFFNMCRKMNDYWSSFTGTFEMFLEHMFYTGQFPYGNWFDYILDWEDVLKSENSDHILHMHYEELKHDLRKAVDKIAQFLQIQCEATFLDEIAEKCEFNKMKPGKESCQSPLWKYCTKDGNMPIFRKGDVGDWKNWFTPEQNEKFDKEFKRRMKTSSLTFQFEP